MKILTYLTAFALILSPVAAEEIEWNPIIYPDDQIFPSFIIGTAVMRMQDGSFPAWGGNHLGDPQGAIGIWADQIPEGSKIEVKVHENDFMKAGRFTGTVKEGGEIRVHPKIPYKYDALMRVKQVMPLDITIEVSLDGETLGEKTISTTLRTVNDCLFGVIEGADDNEYSDYSWLFAAYVNEDHPWVDRTLKEALSTKIVPAFDGYQSGDPEQVLLQIFSIWNVMQRKGLRYSNITTTSARSQSVNSQHVRLFDESIDAAQANCVDGTVLLAAVLRKIGLDPSLVIVPGHMFLAVALDPEAETVIGIETTMMGAADLSEINDSQLRSLLKFDPEDASDRKIEESWATFEAALDRGTAVLNECQEHFDSDDPNYWIINLAAARDLGILPISSVVTSR